MRRFMLTLAPIVIVGAAVWFFSHYKIEGLEHLRVRPREGSGWIVSGSTSPAVARDGETILVASFNIQVFGESKIAKPKVVDTLAKIIRRFDVVAIQEIRAEDQTVLPRFLEKVNAEGGHYDFVIGSRLGRTSSKEQYAFIYNRASLETLEGTVYDVEDPADRLHREPFVAGFRVRGPPANQAFTFSLVNIHTDPDEVEHEMAALDDAFRAVRNDGHGEDDIIVLGDLNTDDRNLGEFGAVSYVHCAISGVPSNTRGTKLYDNIVFDERATIEFTGRSGVLNLIEEYQLSMAEALEVSDHMPVWAEFSIHEGGGAGRIAARPAEQAR